MISIICPIYNEGKYIEACIRSVLEADYPQDQMELLLVDGMSTDVTRDIVHSFAQRYPFIQLLDNPNKTVPFAMNIGIKAAKGEYIIRLDAHASYPKDYFSCLLQGMQANDADNVGGICLTKPGAETVEALAIAEALSSRFGMGNSYFRIGAARDREVDTVPFGCFRRELFQEIGYFDEMLVRNQDDEFNGRIIRNGGKIVLLKDILIEYFARDKVSKTARMFYQYGLYKPLVNKKLGSPATIRQFFPAAFVSALVLPLLLAPFSFYLGLLWVLVLALYGMSALLFSLNPARRNNNFALLYWLPYIFFVIHASYGVGYWKGLYKVVMKRSFDVKTNR